MQYAELSNTEKGWKKEGGSWYYRENGKLATGWKKVNGNWYHLKENGVMSTGWVKDGSYWYYLKASGEMQTGWLTDRSQRSPFWKSILVILASMVLWLVVFFATSFLPANLNPVLAPLPLAILGAALLALRFYLKKRFNIRSASAGPSRY